MKPTRIVVSLVIWWLAGAAIAAEQPDWTMATPWPKGSYEHKRAQSIAKEMAGALGSPLVVRTGDAKDLPVDRLFQAARAGLVPVSEWVLDQAAFAEPLLSFNNLPTPSTDFAAAKKEFDRRKALIATTLQRHGLVLLMLTPWEPPGLFSQRAPTSLDAVSSYKVKVYDRFGTEFIKKLGGEPHELGFRQLSNAFKRGRVNAVLTSPTMALAAKVHNRTMYFTELKLALPVNAIVMGQAYWAKLSAGQRKKLLQTNTRVETLVWQQMKKRYQESIGRLQARGMIVADELPEWLENATQSIATEMQQSWRAGLSSADAKQFGEAH